LWFFIDKYEKNGILKYAGSFLRKTNPVGRTIWLAFMGAIVLPPVTQSKKPGKYNFTWKRRAREGTGLADKRFLGGTNEISG
jgi:hypothetical protein